MVHHQQNTNFYLQGRIVELNRGRHDDDVGTSYPNYVYLYPDPKSILLVMETHPYGTWTFFTTQQSAVIAGRIVAIIQRRQ